MTREHVFEIDDDVAVWLESGGGITILAAECERSPVELSPAQAQRLAAALVRLIELYEQAG